MTRAQPAESAHVALLRGINVGGHNLLPMKQLAAIFEAAGCSEVKTYIQSGNVVFRAAPAAAVKLPALLTKAIEKELGLRIPLVLRTGQELEQVARRNPFLAQGVSEDLVQVMFLADAPSATAAGSLDPTRSPPDEFRLIGREIYLHCPNGMARTKLSNAWFDSKLKTVSTSRNWRTVLKLLELSRMVGQSLS